MGQGLLGKIEVTGPGSSLTLVILNTWDHSYMVERRESLRKELSEELASPHQYLPCVLRREDACFYSHSFWRGTFPGVYLERAEKMPPAPNLTPSSTQSRGFYRKPLRGGGGGWAEGRRIPSRDWRWDREWRWGSCGLSFEPDLSTSTGRLHQQRLSYGSQFGTLKAPSLRVGGWIFQG